MKKCALNVAHVLPVIAEGLRTARSRELQKTTPLARFRWQDTAVRKIKQWREQQAWTQQGQFGFLGIINASTGAGKTLAVPKLMQALSEDQQSLRYSLALGLRI